MSGAFGSSQWMYNSSTGFYDYTIDQSLRFDDGSSTVLHRTPSSASNRKTWSFSCWIKLSTLQDDAGRNFSIFSAGGNVYNRRVDVSIGSSYKLMFFMDGRADGASYYSFIADRLLRDASGWMHILAVMDTTDSTADDRLKFYVNGERQSGAYQYGNGAPPLNSDWYVNSTYEHDIGDGHHNTVTQFFDGYMAEVNFIDGTALDPTSFGETSNGIWVPKQYSGSYGTNGFYLTFADSSAIGDDLSGNINDFTATNLAAHDVVLDSPTNSFPTLNYLQVSSNITLAEGNLKSTTTNTASSHQAYSTMNIPTSGKWYFECYAVLPRADDLEFGISEIPTPDDRNANHLTTQLYNASADACAILNNSSGNLSIRQQSGTGILASSITGSTGDIYQIAFDCDTGKVFLGRNNTYYRVGAADGDPSSGTNPSKTITANKEYCIGLSCYGGNGAGGGIINYGQDSTFAGNTTAGGNADANGIGDFKYAPPSGFLALCSANLPEPAIGPNSATQADDYFNTVLYTGDGTSSNAITGVGFQPDFLWIKQRSAIRGHQLMDSVRGASVRLRSEVTDAESTSALVSFDSDGFTVDGSTLNGTNISGGTFVGWCWKAGGTAVSNTDGSITSSVSANQDAGFSIVSYESTGSNATVGHGLSSAPELIIIKERDNANGWAVSIKGDPTDFLRLDTTAAQSDDAAVFNDTAPTSTVFSIGTAAMVNRDSMIAYCFHSVENFSRVGKFYGNGNSNGPYVAVGFRPAFLLIRRIDSGNNWHMFDNKRDTFNVVDANLYPNLNNAEATGTAVDFLSNGLKIRSSAAAFNASGGSYIYLAFAEAPFKYANAR